MRFVFEQIRTGGDRNFGYLIGDREEKVAIVVDPSYDPEGIVQRAKAQGVEIKALLNTHGHHDHTNGNERVQELTGAVLLSPKDGDVIPVGSFSITVYETPGHASDHICLFEPTYKILLTGDHLFVGKIGGTSSRENSQEQYDSLHRLLLELPPETTIWPGHDYGARPSSTLQMESKTNPFLLAEDFEAFVQLKHDWPRFKQEHGLR